MPSLDAAFALTVVESESRWVEARYRGTTHRESVPWSAPTEAGSYYFEGRPGAFKRKLGQVCAWEDDHRLVSEALRSLPEDRRMLFSRFDARGIWLRDSAGNLAELGVHDGTPVLSVLGWPLVAVQGMTLAVREHPLLPGVLVLRGDPPPHAVLKTSYSFAHYTSVPSEGSAVLAHYGLPSTPCESNGRRGMVTSGGGPNRPPRPEVARAIQPPPEPQPVVGEDPLLPLDPPSSSTAPVQVERVFRVPINAVEYLDSAVVWRELRQEAIPCAESQEVFEELKEILGREISDPVVIEATLLGEECLSARATLPASFGSVFKRERREQALRTLRGSRRLTSWDDVSEALGHDDIEDIIEDEDLVSVARRDALRFVFGHRDRDERTYLWEDNALLVPVLGGEGAKRYLWEHLDEDNATYVFKGTDLDALLELVRQDRWKSSLLADRARRDAVGYSGRVLHRGDLEAWQESISGLVGWTH